MGAKSRNKGASGEREFAALVKAETGIELKRNLTQYQKAQGYDLEGAEGYAIEVKRHKTATRATIDAWWAETLAQARLAKKMPVLAYRVDFGKWRVCILSPWAYQKELDHEYADITANHWFLLMKDGRC